MSRKTLSPGPNQDVLPLEGLDLPPVILPEGETPLHGIGPNTSVVEGWVMLDGVIKEIARARSNIGFLKLSEQSRPVKKFAEKLETDGAEAQQAVQRTVDVHVGSPHFTHYKRAQWRLDRFNDKQIAKAIKDPRMGKVGDLTVVRRMMPQTVGQVEHRFFHANNPAEERSKGSQRQKIARFVRKHS